MLEMHMMVNPDKVIMPPMIRVIRVAAKSLYEGRTISHATIGAKLTNAKIE
jgi:hypothetical protein